MVLSEILKKKEWESGPIISMEREKQFDVLALSASNIQKPSCIFLDNDKFLRDMKSNVTMVITTPELAPYVRKMDVGICIAQSPRLLFFEIHNFLSQNEQYTRKRVDCQIGSNCRIDQSASIAEKNVLIGNNVTIEEFVVIRENTVIGDNSIIRAGAKIGGEGFEFKKSNGKLIPVKHLGGVRIGSYVEIQYNSCIDKAVYPWDDTIIGDYTKIDNLVHIGHAVKIADNVLIVAQSGIGGRTVIGADSWVGFATTTSNALQIGENVRINIGAVVTKDVGDHASVTGNFAIEHKKFIENLKKISS